MLQNLDKFKILFGEAMDWPKLLKANEVCQILDRKFLPIFLLFMPCRKFDIVLVLSIIQSQPSAGLPSI